MPSFPKQILAFLLGVGFGTDRKDGSVIQFCTGALKTPYSSHISKKALLDSKKSPGSELGIQTFQRSVDAKVLRLCVCLTLNINQSVVCLGFDIEYIP